MGMEQTDELDGLVYLSEVGSYHWQQITANQIANTLSFSCQAIVKSHSANSITCQKINMELKGQKNVALIGSDMWF